MRKVDIEGICELAGGALAAGGGLIQKMHAGIAERPFGILGPAAAPVRVIHDRIAGSVYDGLRGAYGAAARTAASLWSEAADDGGPNLAATPGGALGLAALNGLYGNHLEAAGNGLTFKMEVRRDGAEVSLSPGAVAETFPAATPRLAVFVHGLFETDDSWRHFPLGGDAARRRTYGDRLGEELSFTPVYIRYNTGLHVSENGRELARLLQDLTAAWPTRVTEIVLVGHSMGGLVARSACHYAAEDEQGWTQHVRHVFCLGTPHLGADLEKGLNALGAALGRLPETRGLAAFVNARSVGIKDLRFGSCVEEDWCDCDPDEFLRDRCQEVPFLPDANYYFIAATIARGRLGATMGDLLVRVPSASGRGNGTGRRIPFEVDNGYEITGLTHFHLLNHPAVYDQIRTWITCPAPVEHQSV